MTDNENKIINRLLNGRIPVELLLHIQDSAERLDHGQIEIVFQGMGSPMDVITKERKRFST